MMCNRCIRDDAGDADDAIDFIIVPGHCPIVMTSRLAYRLSSARLAGPLSLDMIGRPWFPRCSM